MSTRPRSSPRSVGKENQSGVTNVAVAEQIRLQIVGGEFLPGDRLPPRAELESRFGTTTVTIQRAFNILASDGFVEPRGWRGTFVAQYPPHTSRFALVFPEAAEASPFWRLLREEAAKFENSLECRIAVFSNVNGQSNSADYRRLLHEINTHQLAGIIWAMPQHSLLGTPIFQNRTLPMAAIADEPDMGMPIARIEYDSFFEQALEYLALRGRKAVGGLTMAGAIVLHGEAIFGGAARHGLKTKPYWWLPVNRYAAAARVYTTLLMESERPGRPDALVVSDDTLLGPVLEGLQDARVRVPEDVEIVVLCNFPASSPPQVPMRRLGYHAPQILRTCLGLVACQQAGQTPPEITPIHPVWESDTGESDTGEGA